MIQVLKMKTGTRKFSLLGISLILLFVFGKSSGLSVTEKTKIEQHLKKYFDNIRESTGLQAQGRKDIVAKYLDETTSSKVMGITLTKVAQIVISVEEAATLGNKASCDESNQDLIDSLYADGWHDHSFKETLDHFVKLADSKKKFCNFFAYLRCTENPMGKDSSCECLPSMVWQTDKCVFRDKQKCDDISGLTEEHKVFPVFDFKEQDFTRHIPSNCAGKSTCRHGESNLCELYDDFDYLASPAELSTFLRNKIAGVDDHIKAQMLRIALKDITHNSRKLFRLALSLEMRMEGRLLGFTDGCTPADDEEFLEIMKNYNSRDSPAAWFADGDNIGMDTIRLEFMKQVMKKAPRKVCNHFDLLSCTGTRCDCSEKLGLSHDGSYDSAGDHGKQTCDHLHGSRCNYNVLKKFQIQSHVKTVGSAAGDKDVVVGLSYYTSNPLRCDDAHITNACQNFLHFGHFCLSGPGYYETVDENFKLEMEFEKTFSIGIGGDCSIEDQKHLFETANSFDWNLSNNVEDAKKVVKELVAKGSRYCRIRHYTTCSPEGKCICVPPTVPNTNHRSCALPRTWECDKVHKTELHSQLDRLKLYTGHKQIGMLEANLPCESAQICHDYHFFKGKHCLCSWATTYGQQCEKQSIHHLAHIRIDKLPVSMRNIEGHHLIRDLEEPISKLDAAMTLRLDKACEPLPNQELVRILDFLASVREECNCAWKVDLVDKTKGEWWCDKDSLCEGDGISSGFQKSNFEDLLKQTKALASKRIQFCNMNHALRCVNNKCGCAEDYFLEDGNCRVDLGGRCYKVKVDDDHTASCRSGLKCTEANEFPKKSRCAPEGYTCSGENCNTASAYLLGAKKKLIDELKTGAAELKNDRRTIKLNAPCSPTDENQIKTTLHEAEAELKIADSSGNVESERQKIRMLQKILASVTELKDTNLCKKDYVCSPKTNKCEDPKNPTTSQQNSTPNTPLLSASSAGHFQRMCVFNLALLVFISVVVFSDQLKREL